MKNIHIKQVDAFTTTPLYGNPAGVVTDAACLTEDEKQSIATEMNLTETAFVTPSDVADFRVQFITPRFEVDLCGHATIATFSALYEEGKLDPSKKVFYQETLAGVLPVEVTERDGNTVFMMTQVPPSFEEIPMDRSSVAKLISLEESDLLDTPVMRVHTGQWWMVFGVKSLDKLMNAKWDLRAIEKASVDYNVIGVSPFCMETLDKEKTYHIRNSGPICGCIEDPVCGTGNGVVSCYIVQNNLIECNDEVDMIGEQGFEVNKPGQAYTHVSKKEGKIDEIKVGGTGVTVLEGNMKVAPNPKAWHMEKFGQK